MKKIVLCLMVLMLWGCKEADPVVETPEVVIERDEEAYHSMKIYSFNNLIPHLMKYYDEMDDDTYGSFIIETLDSNFELVYRIEYRDLIKQSDSFADKPTVHEDKLVTNVQGVVGIHDLLTGAFLWEVETRGVTDYAVYDGILYVLNHDEDLITSFDLQTGQELMHIRSSARNLTDLQVDGRSIIAYYRALHETDKNGFEYAMDGSYLRKVHVGNQDQGITTWSKAESSDESDTAQLAVDGNIHTAWQESVKGYGTKEWIELTRPLPTLVNRLVIFNGDQSSEKAYDENAKLKQAVISVGDGKSFLYKFEQFEYGKPEVIEFVKPITADYILITIEEAEPGTMFKSTGISEIYTE